VRLRSKLFDEESSQEDEDYLINNLNNFDDGDALAKEFYRQLRERQPETTRQPAAGTRDDDTYDDPSKSQTDHINKDDDNLSSSESQKRNQNAQPFSKRRVVSVASSTNGSNENNKKYTGQQSDSPRFGSTRERSSSSSPREAMMEREFRLAGRGAGLGLGLQAGVAVFALIFYIYVGLSGGIVSADGADFGGDDTIEYEQVIPVPRDTERSVWL
jgi:hypothetical protein